MCGIAGFHSLDGRPIEKAGEFANRLLLEIESRGRDATGFLALSADGTKTLDKYPVPARQFIGGRDRFPAPRTVLLHTRFATTGTRRSITDAHPHVSGHTAAIHNGTIYNADEIFKAFDLPRQAKVDSEVIPALIEYAGWDKAEEALSIMDGGAATAVVDVTKPGELILARLRHYPLAVCKTGGVVIFASTPWAISLAYKLTYGKQLRAKIEQLVPGEVLRVNGKIERSGVPGVFGVEKEFDHRPRRQPKSNRRGRSKSKQAQRPAARPKEKLLPLVPAARSERERKLRIEKIRGGSLYTHDEVMAIIDELDEIRSERDSAQSELADVLLASELDWSDETLATTYSPGRWAD